MTDKEIRNLSRADLLEMLIQLSRDNEDLQAQIEALKAQLDDREIKIEKAGSIAEAALQINGVFAAAEAAAAQYLENLEKYADFSDKMQKEAEQKANKIVEDAKVTAKKLVDEADVKAKEITDKAKAESQEYWDAVSKRVNQFWSDYKGLREFLGVELKHNP